jgi:hypothetical protein
MSERGKMYEEQLRDLYTRIENDCMRGRIDPADVMHITNPFTRVKELERAITQAFFKSLYPRR